MSEWDGERDYDGSGPAASPVDSTPPVPAAGPFLYTPNADEAAVAWLVAGRRNTLNSGGSNIPGGETMSEPERRAQHYVACLSEIAVSRITNLCWTGCGIGASGLKDVGDLWQVRSVRDPSRGLLVRPKDDDHDPAALVHVADSRQCTVLGWHWVGFAKEHGHGLGLDTESPCWILRELLPFSPERRPSMSL